ncbi:hypothetical protein M438DRAFT_153216 [Aureobasidium pullulans EXF-150]|uniref:Uncharacterized protein n=1 Tax=Aureobasidium pullulans EXF-150 TaxID=1043002 RepID=A0A074X161_AURPU|nr:uncharacterized protein M438DRAFT_153216 [Aureobasidium pullulans EXF-150]KEQ79108.1 hypothetical protein M438DRAFT_153216 [Aureobasidium pullulans EXF-150]
MRVRQKSRSPLELLIVHVGHAAVDSSCFLQACRRRSSCICRFFATCFSNDFLLARLLRLTISRPTRALLPASFGRSIHLVREGHSTTVTIDCSAAL